MTKITSYKKKKKDLFSINMVIKKNIHKKDNKK